MRFFITIAFFGISQLIFAQTPGNGVTDVEGNTYNSVIIGQQEWMVDNLRTAHYNNGDLIELDVDPETGVVTPSGGAFDYNNTASTLYGKLYNWYAVNDPRKICPTGWKIPSDQDFEILVNFLGGTWAAGGKLKEAGTAHWNPPNNGGTNSSGFTALPAGTRENGLYIEKGDYAYFWSTWDNHPTTRHRWELRTVQTLFDPFNGSMDDGYSCRCLKSGTSGLKNNDKSSFHVYPNPVKSELNISLSSNQVGKPFKIIDISGRIVVSGVITSSENKLNLIDLKPGMYLFSYAGNTELIIKE